MKDGQNRSGLVVALMVALFAMPVAVGSVLFYSGWQPAASAVHGTLVRPPLALKGNFRGHWTLLYAGGADCSDACRTRLGMMRQVQLALGRDWERVRRVAVFSNGLSPERQADLAQSFPGLDLAAANDALVGVDEGKVYLVDPLGNLVLAYGADANPGGIRQDLSRLLAYSWVG